MKTIDHWRLLATLLATAIFVLPAFAQKELPADAFAPTPVEAADEPKANPTFSREDQSLRSAILDSREIYRKKIVPLQQEITRLSTSIQSQLNTQRQLVSILKTADVESLPNLQRQLERLTEQIQLYAQAIDAIAAEDPEAKAKAVQAATKDIAALEKERQEMHQPFTKQMSAIYQRHQPDNQVFADHFDRFFRKQGTGEFAKFTRTRLTGSFGAAQVTAQYKSPENILTISMQAGTQSSNSKQKRQLLVGKHPIISESDRTLMFIVDDVVFSAYIGKKPIPAKELKALAANLMDLDALDKALEKIGEENRDEEEGGEEKQTEPTSNSNE